jgi:hypothetical protein
MSGLPVWTILATLAALAFWYGPENLKIILLLCLLTIVAMMAPGDAHAAAKADLKDLTDHEEEYFYKSLLTLFGMDGTAMAMASMVG